MHLYLKEVNKNNYMGLCKLKHTSVAGDVTKAVFRGVPRLREIIT